MIWYFLAGFICGAVGIVRFAHWFVHKKMKQMEDMNNGTDSNESP